LDFYLGLIPTGIEHLEVEFDQLREEVKQLSDKIVEKEKSKKIKTMLNGTEIVK